MGEEQGAQSQGAHSVYTAMKLSRFFVNVSDEQPKFVKGAKLVFGIPEIKPIRGIATGTAKLILEDGKAALVQVMGGKQDCFFTVEDRGEFWVILKEVKREVVL